jgi:hypothetical protein
LEFVAEKVGIGRVLKVPLSWPTGEEMKIHKQSRFIRASIVALAWAMMLPAVTSTVFAQNGCETVEAIAKGTSTQMGQMVNIRLLFCKFSTPEQRQVLVDAFTKGGTRELTNTLRKMPSAGRISLPSTVGYDLAFIRVIPTPTGRTIRFITNRMIGIGEAWQGGRSMDYSLTAGEIYLDNKDKKKNHGTLYPATELTINKKGEPTWDLYQNPWKLQNIIDWGTKKR